MGQEDNYEFYLKADLHKFAGEWIAIVDRKIVAHNKSAKEAYAKAKASFPDKVPFLACATKPVAMIF